MIEREQRIRTACAELRQTAAGLAKGGCTSWASTLERIARELEGKDSGADAASRESALDEERQAR